MTLFRVIWYREGAREDEPGGALYIPPQGRGRLDNPDLYGVLYTGEHRVGCVVESFARYAVWNWPNFFGSKKITREIRALATYEIDAALLAVCDLDDARMLLHHRLHPSDVITRDYESTRKWARRIYEQRRWNGVRWWSYYESRWANVGLWDLRALKVASIEPLTLAHEAVVAAAATLKRNLDAIQSKARPQRGRRRR